MSRMGVGVGRGLGLGLSLGNGSGIVPWWYSGPASKSEFPSVLCQVCGGTCIQVHRIALSAPATIGSRRLFWLGQIGRFGVQP